MSPVFYLIIGIIVGYIASRLRQTNSLLDLMIYMAEGSVGAFLADYFINPLLNNGTIKTDTTIPTLLVTLAGSVAMILIVQAVHHRDTDERPAL
jgi:uncharacterized membrane protein YeaQ/YmgE (transglycosylase-associated protein family)